MGTVTESWPVHLNKSSAGLDKKLCGAESTLTAFHLYSLQQNCLSLFSPQQAGSVLLSCTSHTIENTLVLLCWQLFVLTRCLGDGSCVNRTRSECLMLLLLVWSCSGVHSMLHIINTLHHTSIIYHISTHKLFHILIWQIKGSICFEQTTLYNVSADV